MMTDREAQTLESEAPKVEGVGRHAAHAADLTEPGSIDKLRAATETAFGPADILVHAAGITGPVGEVEHRMRAGWCQ